MAETGLNQNVNRDYDPLTGKYIESDPLGLKAGINTYAYVKDNPVWFNDPSGLATIECDGNGNYQPVLSAAEKAACDSQCTLAHEQAHIADWIARYGADSCRNKPKGSLPVYGPDYKQFWLKSECNAYRVGKACREKLLTGCCKQTALKGIERDDSGIDSNCNKVP